MAVYRGGRARWASARASPAWLLLVSGVGASAYCCVLGGRNMGWCFFFFLKDCLSLGLCSQPQGSRRRLVQQQAHGKSSTPTPEFLSLRIIPDSVTVAHWPCQVLGLALWPLSQGFRTELQRTLKLAPVMAVFECDSYCPTGPGVWASATCRFVRFAVFSTSRHLISGDSVSLSFYHVTLIPNRTSPVS